MKLVFPEHLPVTEHLSAFYELIAAHQVVIISGSTGSGKTTQIPKALLSAGYGSCARIIHTQPRRIAARNVAARLAEECETPLGSGAIGYAVRFEERLSEHNQVQVLTDGMLLSWLKRDQLLSSVEVVIIDEAHERSVTIDLLLGFLKQLLRRRLDLKLVVMSATIQLDVFRSFFKAAPVLQIEARTYPIDYIYQPIPNDLDKFQQLVETISALLSKKNGDFLVFCSGEGEIRKAALKLRQATLPGLEILPLYARLKISEQQRIFHHSQKRRVILTTNVAETSLTVPNISFVLDFGEARISRYNPRTKIQCLPIEAISKASCDQRAGRCGRTGPGICVRFYELEDYQRRPLFTQPEILRSNLASIILQLLAANGPKPETFPWITPPEPLMVRDGWRILEHLGAIDTQRRLTKLGKNLARLPVDPSLGSILLASEGYQCTREILIIVSALEVPEVLEQSKDQAVLEKRLQAFGDPVSDFKMLLTLWDWIHQQKLALSNREFRQQLKQFGIQETRFREWAQACRQLLTLVHQFKIKINEHPCQDAQLHKALLRGMLSGIGCKQEKEEYLGLRHLKFVLAKPYPKELKNAQWVVAFELVETSKVFARFLARIEPEWIEEVASSLLKRQLGEPYWHEASMRACALERVSLFGLVIIEGKRVDFSHRDPALARALFIREGLVGGRFYSKAPFWKHNQEFIAEQEKLEERFRTRGFVLDEEVQVAFYEERLPKTVVNGKTFEIWLKEVPSDHLYFRQEQFTPKSVEQAQEFPTQVFIRGIPLTIRYCFEPGAEADGVSFLIPLLLLPRFERQDFSWLVEGLLCERITALIKTLPKHLRRNVSPASAFAGAALERLAVHAGDLLVQLASVLTAITGITIVAKDFKEEALVMHLRPRFEIMSNENKALRAGRDLDLLKQGVLAKVSAQDKDPNSPVITRWPGTIARTTTEVISGISVVRYHALVDHHTHVCLESVDEAFVAAQLHPQGVLRLVKLHLKASLAILQKEIRRGAYWLKLGRYWPVEEMTQCLSELIFYEVFANVAGDIYEEQDFLACLEQRKGLLFSALAQLQQIMPALSDSLIQAQEEYARKKQLLKRETQIDLDHQWQFLLAKKTILECSLTQFARYPIYLAAIKKRLEKALVAPLREHQYCQSLKALETAYQGLQEQPLKSLEQKHFLAQFLWQVQELRVSLFAEQLKAQGLVSLKRLQQALENFTKNRLD